ncbi:MAG TPA: hypothetical protein VMW56_07980 [Candidatus Margulisiibacteriota bacterium]|nr:hypothetical protein [Candidatus Margulisiibacteriota bacterium]
MLIGTATELVARTLRLWIYRQRHTPVLNVVIVFGLIMGALASRIRPLGLPLVVGIAVGVGLVYEIGNLRVLKWWDFPDERLAFIRGHAAIVVVLALLWGAVPVMIVGVQAVIPRVSETVLGVSRLERLNQRERQLTRKLDGLRERVRAVETQLDEVRTLKQTLIGRRAVRRLGSSDANPAPTP